MIRALLNSLLFFPSREIEHTPAQAGLSHRELALAGAAVAEEIASWASGLGPPA
jgi:hypothetical protein